MRIVVKVGTSTLAYPTGRLNIRHTEELVKVLSAQRIPPPSRPALPWDSAS